MNDFSYELPDELLAKEPASPRDSSRLFVYDTATDEISLDHFFHVDRYLPKDSFLVLNETKVMPARIMVRKDTGGRVELLLLVNEWKKGDSVIRGISDRKLHVGQELWISQRLSLKVCEQQENIFLLQPSFDMTLLPEILDRFGVMPIPPYIKKTPLSETELRKKYQTVFAKNSGSIAAPTAALHFTDRVFAKLESCGISVQKLTLQVGLGTFAPVTDEQLRQKKLHHECYEISPDSMRRIETAKRQGKTLVAAGTTTVRTLESCALTGVSNGSTDLFIMPGFQFRMVDCLITNFHLSRSSLMMLVEAFLHHKRSRRSLRQLYQKAIEMKFRFYSFGDSMLIL